MECIKYSIAAAALLAAACSGESGASVSGAPSSGESVSASSLPGAPAQTELSGARLTPAWAKVAPGAECSLHLAGDADPSHALHLFADDDGVVSFAADSQASSDAAQAVLDCNEAGVAHPYAVDFRDAAIRTRPAIARRADAVIRPALSGDPRLVTQAELVKGGYPLRPDPDRSPAMYATWLRAVSTPTELVGRGFVARAGVDTHYGNGASGTLKEESPWGGAELNAGTSYSVVVAQWTLPSSIPSVSQGGVYTAPIWAGLDGDTDHGGSPDVIQAGTTFEVIGIQLGKTSLVASYGGVFGWAEYYSPTGTAAPTTPYTAGITISIGETIMVEAYPCDSNGNANMHGGYAFFEVEDVTTGKATTTTAGNFIKAPDNQFVGGTAEFIIEKEVNGNLLAPYGTIDIVGLAGGTDGNLHDFASDPVLIDDSHSFNQFESATVTGPVSLQMTWLAPQ